MTSSIVVSDVMAGENSIVNPGVSNEAHGGVQVRRFGSLTSALPADQPTKVGVTRN